MPIERRIHFDPFALDLVNECLWHGSQVIKLRPKAFAVLELLLSRPGELITKEDLIAAVWRDTFVGDAVLKVAVRQIREALSDDPKSPRFIETAHRRGYRFIGAIGPASTGPAAAQASTAPALAVGQPRTARTPDTFVGRDRALSRLLGVFERVREGVPRLVFVTGEAGIGKTTLVEAFSLAIAGDSSVRICGGQCRTIRNERGVLACPGRRPRVVPRTSKCG